MAKFTSTAELNMWWRGIWQFVGAAGTEFSLPDSLQDEFDGEMSGLIPGLTWTETVSNVTLPVAQSDVDGLTDALAGKAAAIHSHAESAVTNLTSDLAGKFDKTGGTISGAVTVTGTFIGPTALFKGKPHANVRAFGAKGDGVEDDTTAFNLAISAVSSGFGVVYIPSGTYLLSSTLTVPIGVSLQGDDRASVLYLKDASNCTMVKLAEGEDGNFLTMRQYVRDLMLDGNKSNQSSGAYYGIEIVASTATSVRNSTLLFDNVWVQFTKSSGFYLGAKRVGNIFNRCISWASGSYGFQVSSSDNQFIACSGGQNVVNFYVDDWTNAVLGGQWFSATGDASIWINDPGRFTRIIGADIDSNYQAGIKVQGDDNIIVGNSIRGNGLSADNTYPYVDVITPHVRNIVRDNIIGYKAGTTTKGLAGVRLGSGCTGVFGINQHDSSAVYIECSAASNATPYKYVARPRVAVFRGSNQTISTASFSAQAFGNELYDTNSFHDTSTNNTRLTVTSGVGLSGLYRISGTVQWAANSVGIRQLRIRLNGSSDIAVVSQSPAGGSDSTIMSISKEWALNDGDYVELMLYQSSGGNLDSQASSPSSPTFSMTRLED